jgi:hypothetical protein
MNDIALHTCVASFAGEGKQGVLVQSSRLVIRSLENSGTSHRSLGGSDDGEVLSCNT